MTTARQPGLKKISDLLGCSVTDSSLADSSIADSSRRLSSIFTHIEEIRELQKNLCSRLGPPINQHITVANFHQQTLILHTDSPPWAAKLRFKIPDILDIVRKHRRLTDIQTVRIKVRPVEQRADMAPSASASSPMSPSISSRISPWAAAIIRQAAAGISDAGLRSSLYNLSNNVD